MAQVTASPRNRRADLSSWIPAVLIAAAAYGAGMWLPIWPQGGMPPGDSKKESGAHASDDHSGHDHAGHNEANSIEISEQAQRNIGLELSTVSLQPFTRTLSIPGIIVERPGRTTVQVSAPMTGIVTKIFFGEGEAVVPDQPMFEIRLIHEDLVQAQADLLRTAEELEVVASEIARLEKAAANSAIPGKTILERKYEQQKQQAVLRSQRQALLLHGLSNAQIDAILEDRQLLQFLTIVSPKPSESTRTDDNFSFQLQSLKVAPGQHVAAGESLATLVDHAELFIEGSAFERDSYEINRASVEERAVTAVLESDGQEPKHVPNLKLLYTAAQLDAEGRTLHFYVALPNKVARDSTLGGRRYVAWEYRPGQRAQLLVPVETWEDRIVIPIKGVAQDGAETYVFSPNGDHFDRRTVNVTYKDTNWAVIANDGALFPGDQVAISGAQQLLLALKNKSGGGVDPHAGHNH